MIDPIPNPLDDDVSVECPVCMGTDSDCPRCGGAGEVALQSLTDEERAIVDAAFASDKKRYAEMELDVFDATVPFGSGARAKRSR